MSVMGDLLIQMACYAGVIIFCIVGIAFFMRGYFWKYFKVKTSFGKNLMVKIRTPLRDYFAVGWIEENFLCYKIKDDTGKYTIRIAINSQDKIVYRCMAINWIDVDEEKNAICKANYETVTGFDAKKHSDLHTRALMRPTITSGQEKIILVCVLLTLVISAAALFFAFKGNAMASMIWTNLPGIVNTAVDKGTVIGTNVLA